MMKGRMLYFSLNSYLFSDGYHIIQDTTTESPRDRCIYSVEDKYSKFSTLFITRRLLRAEITSLYLLNDDSMIAVAKKGLFKRSSKGGDFYKTFSIPRGSKPLNLCILPNGHIFF